MHNISERIDTLVSALVFRYVWNLGSILDETGSCVSGRDFKSFFRQMGSTTMSLWTVLPLHFRSALLTLGVGVRILPLVDNLALIAT